MQARDFYNCLKKNDVNFFCGVPDSLLKDFCAYVADNESEKNHVITANEGNAIALASGHYLATGNPAVVYMQNSGLGNCVNPLLSLTDEEVYNIPLLMLIGWRGEPGEKDEPQHIKQGRVTNKLLEVMDINYSILPLEFESAKTTVQKAFEYMRKTKKPYALIVKKGTFEKYSRNSEQKNDYEIVREEAISEVLKNLSDDDIVISTTGQISRELYELREKTGQSHKRDFLTVGSMGHANSIALGIALEKPERNVFCFEGDGACIMHMGSLPVIGSKKIKNFKHIIFNNEAHDSVGAQPTCANLINFEKLAPACGYDKAFTVSTKKELCKTIKKFINSKGTCLLEIKVKCGARDDLGRPKEKPIENKGSFMSFLSENKTYFGKNSIKNLSEILRAEKAKNILIFTGKKSFDLVKPVIKKQLSELNCTYFNDFSTNPKSNEIKNAVNKLDENFDLIVAIGGGSVIDFAKLFKFSIDNDIDAEAYFKAPFKLIKKTKLIAIPTTAGTGAESTQFAVFYIDGIKYALEDKSILPDYAIVDSQFVKKIPKYIKACCGLDAYCQAIESFWSVNSTKESLEFAAEAIELCRGYLEKYVNSGNPKYAEKMALASNLAGKAINISKTTAAHAISYVLTSKYNIPHGHAVALSIPKLMEYNMCVDENSVQDKREVDYVKSQMNKLYELIKTNDPVEYFLDLFGKIGIEYDLEKLGVKDINTIINFIDKDRLKNNPKKLSKEELELILAPSCDKSITRASK